MNQLHSNSLTLMHVKLSRMDASPKLKLEQYQLEIQYVIKVFCAVYKKFLTVIDHIDYHPSQIQNTTQDKRSEEYDLYGHYHSHNANINFI